jgi:hypothetical protein
MLVGLTLGCGSHKGKVSPLSADLAVQNVCIERNPAVAVQDFLPVVENGFTRHGISHQVYLDDFPENCDAVVRYTALRSWDVTPFLRTANIDVFKDSRKVAWIDYYHPHGFNPSKWASVEEKIGPLMDKMLIEYRRRQ